MKIEPLAIPEVKVITPARHQDGRGFLSEIWQQNAWVDAGILSDFVQDNHSFSVEKGIVRGLHFQTPPMAQAKLVLVITGAIFDVAVDLRKNATTFGQHVTAILSAQNGQQILIPKGFAHGFCTLEPNTHVIYKLSAPYAPDHDKGLLWSDPALGIDWPVDPSQAEVSAKDQVQPLLAELPNYFAG